MMHRGKLVPSALAFANGTIQGNGEVARADCTLGGILKHDLIAIVLTAEACAQLLR
jgi:hypothetical protein